MHERKQLVSRSNPRDSGDSFSPGPTPRFPMGLQAGILLAKLNKNSGLYPEAINTQPESVEAAEKHSWALDLYGQVPAQARRDEVIAFCPFRQKS